MRRTIATAIGAALAILAMPAAAQTIDQSQPAIDEEAGFLGLGGDSEQMLAQSFTVGVDGDLVGLRLPIAGCGRGDLVLELRMLSAAGMPDGAVVRSVRIAGGDVPAAYAGFQDFFFPAGVAVSAGDVFAFVARVDGEDGYCSYATSPTGDLYPRGQGFFDARPNPPGWISFKEFAGSPQDLAFFTLMEDAGAPGPSANRCIGFTAGGPTPLPFSDDLPICRCLEDPGLNEWRCRLMHPDFFMVRRIPLPPFNAAPDLVAEEWAFTPLKKLDGPVRMTVPGAFGKKPIIHEFGGRSKPDGFEYFSVSRDLKDGVIEPGIVRFSYPMEGATSAFQKEFGFDPSYEPDDVK